MSHLSFFISIFVSITVLGQKKWDGGGGNNQWSNALNWSGNTLPTSSDDVVIDNSIVTVNYSIVLPNAAVTVRTVTIAPTTGRTIDLTLPATNIAVPGFTVSGPGYGMTINSGGTFRNSSGSTSGNAVVVLDSIRINNEGRYIHNSSGSHVGNVIILSRAAGTERGIFEFDIPTASSTISLSARTFGRLALRSTAAGGTCNYTAAGTSRVTIRNTLDIGAGVNLNLNCSDTIFVAGDLLQEAGTLNLGNSTRSVVMNVQQNITQNTGAIITETGTGIQALLMGGIGLQVIILKGSVNNSVAIVKDGAASALFKAPVSLPYKLVLRNGRIVTTQGLITLQAACTIETDTMLLTNFIDGPLKKDGLNNQHFLFPVGKGGTMRWLQVMNATGNFTVEYFKSDPHVTSDIEGTGINHFSTVEYWDVNTASTSTAKVKLSFDDPHSGGVTNLTSLRVARLINGIWEDAGNGGVSGTPGSDGWVSSNAASGFSASSKLFALASATGLENPLPLSSMQLRAITNVNNVYLYCTMNTDLPISTAELQSSPDNMNFSPVKRFNAPVPGDRISHTVKTSQQKTYYRVVAQDINKHQLLSNVVCINGSVGDNISIDGSNIVSSFIRLSLGNNINTNLKIIVYDVSGTVHSQLTLNTRQSPSVCIDVSRLRAGLYFISELATGTLLRFVKL